MVMIMSPFAFYVSNWKAIAANAEHLYALKHTEIWLFVVLMVEPVKCKL